MCCPRVTLAMQCVVGTAKAVLRTGCCGDGHCWSSLPPPSYLDTLVLININGGGSLQVAECGDVTQACAGLGEGAGGWGGKGRTAKTEGRGQGRGD